MNVTQLQQSIRFLWSARPAGDEGGRAWDRGRRAALTTAASLVGRGLGILVALVSVPLSLSYLDKERYGLWLSITSFIAMLNFADLGISNGLLNVLAAANGRNDRQAARQSTTSALVTLLAVASVLGLGFFLLYPAIPWAKVYNLRSVDAAADAGPATAVLMATFLVGLPLGVVQVVRSGFQEGYVNSVWAIVGNVLGLVGLLVAVRMRATLPWLALGLSGAPLVGTLGNWATLLLRGRRWLTPRLADFSGPTARAILRTGLLFLVLQVTVAFAFNSDNMVVAQLLGVDAVVEYGLGAKPFMFAASLVAVFLSPLWPAYGESIASGDVAWARRTLLNSVRLSLLSTSLLGVVLVALGPGLIRLWTRTSLEVPRSLLVPFAAWLVLSTVGNAAAMYLNARSLVRVQVIMAISLAVLAVAFKFLFAGWFQSAGVAWATSVAYVPCALLPAYYVIRADLELLGRRPEPAPVAAG